MIDRYDEILAMVGRSYERGDCMETVRDVRILAGKPFPMPADYTTESIERWRDQFEMCEPEPYAIVEMPGTNHQAHLGVLLPDCQRVIHASKFAGAVVIQRLSRVKVLGIWRTKAA